MLTEFYRNTSTYLLENVGTTVIYTMVVVTTLVSILYFIAISYVLTKVDKTYFLRKNLISNPLSQQQQDHRATDFPRQLTINSSLSVVIEAFKISTGLVLVLIGIAMLVLPGQGLITILIGLSLLPFPGKHRLEQKLLSRPSVQSTLNWIRIKAKKEPFIFD